MTKAKHCPVCGTKLNMYNRGPFCHAHTPGEKVYEVIPITKCAGRPEPNDSINDQEVDGFEKLLIGVIDENHNLVPLFEEDDECT